MTRVRANSRRATNRPIAATPAALQPLDASLHSIVGNLEGLDLDGGAPSVARPFGGRTAQPSSTLAPDESAGVPAAVRGVQRSRQSIRRILRSAAEDGVGAPFDRRAAQTREGVGLKAGALLVREWNGRLERVMILEQGFAWNGHTFASLSQIAKAMTGTNWNGHRFFGLRQGKTAPADAAADRRKSRDRTASHGANGGSAGNASP